MKKFTKTAALTAVFAVLASTTAFAGSDSKSMTIGGASCYGSLYTNRPTSSITSASASSSISGGSGTAYVTMTSYSNTKPVSTNYSPGPNSVYVSGSYSTSQYVDTVVSSHSFSVNGQTGSFTNTAY